MNARSDLSEPGRSQEPALSLQRRFVAQLKRLLGLLRDKFPLTARGAGLLASAASGLTWLGFGALDQVWYVAGLVLLGLVALSLLLVLLGTLRVFVWLRRSALEVQPVAQRIDTSAQCMTGFRVTRLRYFPLVDLRLSVIAPRHVVAEALARKGLAEECIRVADRGELRALTRSFEIRDVFGLAALRLVREGRVEVDVLPHMGALRSLPMLRSLAGGDDLPHPMGLLAGDRLDLRRYAPSDPARFIHWKAFARTQKLVVRVPERALSRAQRVAAYLVSGARDGASAAVARVALEEGAFGDDFRFGADGTQTPTDRVADALLSVCRSAHARASGGRGLAAFLETVEREGPVSLLLFVPAELGAEYQAVMQVVQRRARPPRVVIGVDGLEVAALEPLWKRVAFLPARTVRVPTRMLRETVGAYRKLGAEVLVFDRETGRVLSDAHFAEVRGAAA